MTLLHVSQFWVGTQYRPYRPYRLAIAGSNTVDKCAHFFSHNCVCGLFFIESGFEITGIRSVLLIY
jgi:hypothetical protein